jgi:hypothetical protein
MNDIILNVRINRFLSHWGIIFFLAFQHQKRQQQKLDQLPVKKGGTSSIFESLWRRA